MYIVYNDIQVTHFKMWENISVPIKQFRIEIQIGYISNILLFFFAETIYLDVIKDRYSCSSLENMPCIMWQNRMIWTRQTQLVCWMPARRANLNPGGLLPATLTYAFCTVESKNYAPGLSHKGRKYNLDCLYGGNVFY